MFTALWKVTCCYYYRDKWHWCSERHRSKASFTLSPYLERHSLHNSHGHWRILKWLSGDTRNWLSCNISWRNQLLGSWKMVFPKHRSICTAQHEDFQCKENRRRVGYVRGIDLALQMSVVYTEFDVNYVKMNWNIEDPTQCNTNDWLAGPAKKKCCPLAEEIRNASLLGQEAWGKW